MLAYRCVGIRMFLVTLIITMIISINSLHLQNREIDSAKMYWQLLTGNGSVLSRDQLKKIDIAVLTNIAKLFTLKKKRSKDEL